MMNMNKFIKKFVIKEIIPPFNFRESVKGAFFAPWNYSEDCLYGVIRLKSGKLAKIELKPRGNALKPELKITVLSNRKLDTYDLKDVQQFIIRNFGLKEDLSNFYKLAKEDSVLGQVIEDLYGTRLVGNPPFISMVITICSQNTTLKMAQRMIERIVENFGDILEIDQEVYHCFPTPAKLARCPVEELRKCKVGYRAPYIKNFAQMVHRNKINLQSIEKMSVNEAERVLTTIRGVGPYTARVMLLFAFRKYESFWIDSLVRKIFSVLYFNKRKISDKEIIEYVNRKWKEYRGLALFYILRDLDSLAKRLGLKISTGIDLT